MAIKSKIRNAALCTAILVGTASPIHAANHGPLTVEPRKDNAIISQEKNLAKIPKNTIMEVTLAGLVTGSIYAARHKLRRDIENDLEQKSH